MEKLKFDDEKAYDFAHDYFCKKYFKYYGENFKFYFNYYPNLKRYMPIVISQLIKESKPFVLKELIKVLFGKILF